jgi:hypothetical protein
MQILKKKTTTTIALILILAIASTIFATPIANAHTPGWSVPTWTYLSVAYNPIGVGQQTLLVFWADKYPPDATGNNGDHWRFTVDVTAPDGSKETLGPIESDPVGGAYTGYTPTQAGNYTVVAHFVEHKITGENPPAIWLWGMDASIGDTYLASDSDPVQLIVQEEPVQGWSEAPLPTQFWTRPINSMNRNWYNLAGNWLAGAAQNVNATTGFGYGAGPESAHIMWTTPMADGGLMDARYGDEGYTSIQYEGLAYNPPIILDGKLYYNVPYPVQEGWRCLDLYTGEELYYHNTTGPVIVFSGPPDYGGIYGESLAFGQIYIFDCPSQHGGFPYLWSTPPSSMYGGLATGAQTNWMMFDASTGNYICSISNAPSGGTAVYGHEGSILRYNIAGQQPLGPYGPTTAPFYLQCWNTSQAIWWKGTQQQWQNGDPTVFPLENNWYWRPAINATYDGSHGYSLNVSLPWTSASGSIQTVREDEFVIGGSAGSNSEQGVTPGYLWALNLNPKNGAMGSLLWNITFTPPSSAGNKTISMGTVDPEDGVFLFSCKQTREWWGYSLETGQQIWGPTASEQAMNFYGIISNIYQGKLLTCGYGGVLVAYDIKTGKVQWNYTAANVGFESPYGNYPIGIGCIADGKIYLGSCEHSPGQPLWRGSYIRCINASNGAELWKCSLFGVTLTGGASGSNFAISDGYLTALNSYDNQIYCFGKGPSATTVTAPDTASPLGSSVMIRGTVTDQTPTTKAKGTPAISDEDQQAWMEYMYEQQGMPANAKGVAISLDTVDPNGNFVHIGDVTSDTSGAFGYMWKPEVPGTYRVIATFAGSASYYSSFAQTYVGITEGPTATAAPTSLPESVADTYFVPAIAGLFVLIIVVAIVLALLMLRKRP